MKIIQIASKFFKNKYVFAGVPAIIQNSKKEILLGKRSIDSVFYPNTWGLPGGMIEYGEKIEDALKREVKEELGIEIRLIKKSSEIYENFPNKECNIHTIDIPYYARIVGGRLEARDETSDVKWFNPSEIRNMTLAYSHKKILEGERLI